MRKGEFVASLDFDGFVFGQRFPAQIAALTKHKPLIPGEVPVTGADRKVVNHPFTLSDMVELWMHFGRHVRPEAARMVRDIYNAGGIIIGNTGRTSTLPMVTLTQEGLEEAHLNYFFQDIYYKPEWMRSSDESKHWALVDMKSQGYENIFHYDDNARTVRRLAPLHPDVSFVIVQDLTSGILFSRREMKKHPNVARIAIRDRGKIDNIFVPTQMETLPHLRTK